MRIFVDILSIAVGAMSVSTAFTVRTFYQKPLGINKFGPPVPLWFGRLIGLLVGAVFLASGAWDLLHR